MIQLGISIRLTLSNSWTTYNVITSSLVMVMLMLVGYLRVSQYEYQMEATTCMHTANTLQITGKSSSQTPIQPSLRSKWLTSLLPMVKGAGDILAQDIAYWLVIVEYIRYTILRLYSHWSLANPWDEVAKAAWYTFLDDVNKVMTAKSNSLMCTMMLSMIGSENTSNRSYKWLGDNCMVPPMIERLCQYAFTHMKGSMNERRVEQMGYHRHRTVCCISFSIWIELMLIP